MSKIGCLFWSIFAVLNGGFIGCYALELEAIYQHPHFKLYWLLANAIFCIIWFIGVLIYKASIKIATKEQEEQHQLDEKRRQREAERIAAIPNYFDTKISEDSFREIENVVTSIQKLLWHLDSNNGDFYNWFENLNIPIFQGYDLKKIVRFMIASDLKSGLVGMGSTLDMKNKEGLAIFMAVNVLNSEEGIEYGMLPYISDSTLRAAQKFIDGAQKLFNNEIDTEKLVLAYLLGKYDMDIRLQYLIVLYRFFSLASKADEIVTEQESEYLKQLLTKVHNIDSYADVEKDIIDTVDVTIEMIHINKYDEFKIGKYIVEKQKCVISDIQAEFKISRNRVLEALKTLERCGVIAEDGNKRKLLISRESDLIRLLRGQTALGYNNEDNSTETPVIITTNLPIVHTEEDKEDVKLPESLHLDPLFLEVAKFVVAEQESSVAAIQRKFEIGYNRAGKISDQLETLGIYGPNRGSQGREVLVKDLNQLEEVLLKAGGNKPKSSRAKAKSSANELDSLIGLDSVKKEVQTLTNFIKIQQKREEQGLKSSSVSYHCVFTGNPGTGKTTVARIVADIYKNLGVLKRGHLVETDRAGLVAEYVGQTAVKTNKIIDSALDGVLFIDEAYSLVGGGENDFGKEAIATLLKRMEDDRDRLVVILAGYTKDMKQFIDSNPGLQSRFNRYIEFPDYTAEELYQIFALNLKKYDYHITDEAKAALQHFFEDSVAHKDANFGNGRFVRNIFEKVLENQANRLAPESNLTSERLSEIRVEDLP